MSGAFRERPQAGADLCDELLLSAFTCCCFLFCFFVFSDGEEGSRVRCESGQEEWLNGIGYEHFPLADIRGFHLKKLQLPQRKHPVCTQPPDELDGDLAGPLKHFFIAGGFVQRIKTSTGASVPRLHQQGNRSCLSAYGVGTAAQKLVAAVLVTGANKIDVNQEQ